MVLIKAKVFLLVVHELLAQTEALGAQGTELVMTGGYTLNTGRARDEAFPRLDSHGRGLRKVWEALAAERDLQH